MSPSAAQFILLRPQWLWALLPLALLIFLLLRGQQGRSGWQAHVAPALLARLQVGSTVRRQRYSLWALALGWLLAVIALSGPSWQEQPVPLHQVPKARVLVLDMSLSMLAEDLAPGRLQRMRYKVLDLLSLWQEGETALVAFAADGYVISPLTGDRRNLEALIPALTPAIMPTSGSAPQRGVAEALTLLENSGYTSGEIWLLSDGISSSQAERIAQLLDGRAFRLKLLAIGTPQGGPVRLPDGQLLKDTQDQIVVPRLELAPFRQLARLSQAQLAVITPDQSDLERLLSRPSLSSDKSENEQKSESHHHSQQRLDSGYWLVLLLLPLTLLAFRRGHWLSLLLIALPLSGFAPPAAAQAWQLPDWQALGQFRNRDQQGYDAFMQQDHQRAAELFTDSNWLGSSFYRQGDYQRALEAFAQDESARGWYNQGNALAQLGDYPAAIDAYSEALKRDPGLTQAASNKALLEQLQQQSDQSQGGGDGDSSDDQQQRENGQAGESDDADNSQSAEQQSQDQQQSQQQESQSQDSESAQNSEQQTAQSESPTDAEPEDAAEDKRDSDDPSTEQAKQAQPDSEAARSEQHEQQASQAALERWLEQIPDDPGLLLRNKMRIEHQKRRQPGGRLRQEPQQEVQPW